MIAFKPSKKITPGKQVGFKPEQVASKKSALGLVATPKPQKSGQEIPACGLMVSGK